ncbi:MAG: flagellar basal body rod protein FlgB [Deltaproteobacteria bacterium HGW-Deltaproteobacteria-14]|jgi:flagellar basal-body rod protein FlgB|nr:MAG: flagellar basal body rod protein FlgB [Deltaproteobacteria bacterium HGW-Deltaproteobacteria-14]
MSDPVTLSLQSALDLRYKRHELLANNLANADTPGFQPSDLEFEGALQQELAQGNGPLARTSAQHLPAGGVESVLENTVQRSDVTDSLDGNGVDTDKELARVSENSLQFKATLELLRRRYGAMKQTLTDMSRT